MKAVLSANKDADRKEASSTSGAVPLASWTCSKCGKTNPGYTDTCSCGESKR